MISNQSYAILEDQSLILTSANGLLTGSSDVDGNTLWVSSNTQPGHGTLTVQKNGSFMYVPDANYNGWDSFAFVVTDGTGQYAKGWATIQIGEFLGCSGAFRGFEHHAQLVTNTQRLSRV